MNVVPSQLAQLSVSALPSAQELDRALRDASPAEIVAAALKIWSGDIRANVAKAQAMVLERARDNGLAALGQWSRAD